MARQRRGAAARWLGSAAVVMLVSGCAPTDAPVPSPEPTVTVDTTTPALPSFSASPEPTPSPSPSSTLSEEQTAAAETVLEFFRLSTELSKNPTMDLQPLLDITTGPSQMVEVDLISQDRENGLIQTGDDLYYIIDVAKPTKVEDGDVIEVDACSDSTNSDLVSQETGESVLGPDRAYFVEWDIEVLHDGGRWKVGDITNEKVERCGP